LPLIAAAPIKKKKKRAQKSKEKKKWGIHSQPQGVANSVGLFKSWLKAVAGSLNWAFKMAKNKAQPGV